MKCAVFLLAVAVSSLKPLRSGCYHRGGVCRMAAAEKTSGEPEAPANKKEKGKKEPTPADIVDDTTSESALKEPSVPEETKPKVEHIWQYTPSTSTPYRKKVHEHHDHP